MRDGIVHLQHYVDAAVRLPFAWSWRTDVTTWDDPPARFQLDGPFVPGSWGTTVLPDQQPVRWLVCDVQPQRWFAIDIPLDGAVLSFVWEFQSLEARRTRITQHIILAGDNAAAYATQVTEAFGATLRDGMQRLADAMVRAERATECDSPARD